MKNRVLGFKHFVTEALTGNWGYSPLLTEALRPNEQEQVDSWPRGDYSFSDHAFGGDTNKMRTVIPLQDTTDVHPAVQAHLDKHGYEVSDYPAGLAKDKYGRDVKIGKILNKTNAEPEVRQAFENDVRRTAAGQQSAKTPASDLRVVIGRSKNDIGEMSTDRAWQHESCMDMREGCNRHYLARDAQHGTHVAFLVHKDDTEAANPIARIAIKPFVGDKTGRKILKAEERTYGQPDPRFTETVNNWTQKNFPVAENDDQIYHKHHDVYDDDRKSTFASLSGLLNSPEMSTRRQAFDIYKKQIKPEHITKFITGIKTDKDAVTALNHPRATEEHFRQAIDKFKGNIFTRRDLTSALVHKDTNTPSNIIKELYSNPENKDQYSKIAAHPNTPKDVLQDLYKIANTSGRDTVYPSLAKNPNTPEDILRGIHKTYDYEDEVGGGSWTARDVERGLASNPSTPKDIATKLLNSKRGNDVVAKAFANPKVDTKDKLATFEAVSNEGNVRKLADLVDADSIVSSPILTPEHIDKVLEKGGDGYDASRIYTSVANHPNFSSKSYPKLFEAAKTGQFASAAVKSIINYHPDKLSKEHWGTLTSHPNSEVRTTAFRSVPHEDLMEKALTPRETTNPFENENDALWALHENPHKKLSIYQKMLDSGNVTARHLTFYSPHETPNRPTLPASIFKQAIEKHGDDPYMLEYVASHPDIDAESYGKLLRHNVPRVRDAARWNTHRSDKPELMAEFDKYTKEENDKQDNEPIPF